MNENLNKLKLLANHFDVRELSDVVLKDERFPIWSGSSRDTLHHYGTGGLLTHTREVVELCLTTNEYYKDRGYPKYVDNKKLFLAALFHDAGKMWDYRISSDSYGIDFWESSKHKKEVYHITRSALVWDKAADEHGFKDKDDVLHAILAHHGRREWGSPVTPQTRLAWILHLCDGISARIDDCDRNDG